MYKKYLFGMFVFFGLWSVNAVAGGGNNVQSYLESWGGGSLITNAGHLFENTDACIWKSANHNCKTKVAGMHPADGHTDEYAYHMMLAMNINANGAYFCPIQLEAHNKRFKGAWTEYRRMGKESDCVWLCKPGRYGHACQDSAPTTCDESLLKRENYLTEKEIVTKDSNGNEVEQIVYNTLNVVNGNIEDNIAMFQWNQNKKSNEHDIVLAITKWLPGGHGAWVQQITVRAVAADWNGIVSHINAYPAGGAREILVCKDGYKPSGNDCVMADPAVCAQNHACPGWTGFDATQHTWKSVPHPSEKDKTCYEYRCSADGYAFESATNRTCVPCPTQLRQGENTDTGICMHCDNGNDVFSNGRCGPALVLTKNDMQYGYKKTRNTPKLKLENQCWTNVIPDDYKQCVMGGNEVKAVIQGIKDANAN